MAEFTSSMKRTAYCGTLRMADVGKEVTVCGWVQRQRDLGQLIFIDLRDRSGIVQLAFDEKTDRKIFDEAFAIRSEYVLSATGVVRERSSKNKELETGDIEIEVTSLTVLSKALTPPFEIVEESNVKEDLRLQYRYLDLRRADMQRAQRAGSLVAPCSVNYTVGAQPSAEAHAERIDRNGDRACARQSTVAGSIARRHRGYLRYRPPTATRNACGTVSTTKLVPSTRSPSA